MEESDYNPLFDLFELHGYGILVREFTHPQNSLIRLFFLGGGLS